MHQGRCDNGVFSMDNDTIAAIATPTGHGGIGIIRLSGPEAIRIGKILFRPIKKKEGAFNGSHSKEHVSRRLTYGHIIDPKDLQTIDETMMVIMPAPRSYTREDVVEIQCHSGPIILSKILDLVLAQGARLAEPGEFTRRAFLNGRIDLTQAEAIADMINANSEMALKVAFGQLDGRLKKFIDQKIEDLYDILAQLEVGIDFPEDAAGAYDQKQLIDAIDSLCIMQIQSLVDSFEVGRTMRKGIKMAIVGRPNVGKSSLLNRLIKSEKAIVTPHPGTTRDPVEGFYHIGGVALSIIDTAGLHDTKDPVERIGIQRTKQIVSTADLVLMLVAIDTKVVEDDLNIFNSIDCQNIIIVKNKIDLADSHPMISMALPDKMARYPVVSISARTGEGLSDLEKSIRDICIEKVSEGFQNTVLTEERHRHCLIKAIDHLKNARTALIDGYDEALVSIDLKDAINALKGVVGIGIDDALLDSVFSKFCIGK